MGRIRSAVIIGVVMVGLGGGLGGGWAFAQAEPMQPERFGDVVVVSGGFGANEQATMREIKPGYNLHLLFAERDGGAYLASVAVIIADGAGRALAETVAQGPMLFAKLPPGGYRVSATYQGQTQSRDVVVPATGAADSAFYW